MTQRYLTAIVLVILVIIGAVAFFQRLTHAPETFPKSTAAPLSQLSRPIFSSDELSSALPDYYAAGASKSSMEPHKNSLFSKTDYFHDLFKSPDDDQKLGRLDQAFHDFLFDSGTSRADKLDALWQLISELGGVQRLYVIDTMDAF